MGTGKLAVFVRDILFKQELHKIPVVAEQIIFGPAIDIQEREGLDLFGRCTADDVERVVCLANSTTFRAKDRVDGFADGTGKLAFGDGRYAECR